MIDTVVDHESVQQMRACWEHAVYVVSTAIGCIVAEFGIWAVLIQGPRKQLLGCASMLFPVS